MKNHKLSQRLEALENQRLQPEGQLVIVHIVDATLNGNTTSTPLGIHWQRNTQNYKASLLPGEDLDALHTRLKPLTQDGRSVVAMVHYAEMDGGVDEPGWAQAREWTPAE